MTGPKTPPAEHVKFLSDILSVAAGEFDAAARSLGEAKERWDKAKQTLGDAHGNLETYMATVAAEGHTTAKED